MNLTQLKILTFKESVSERFLGGTPMRHVHRGGGNGGGDWLDACSFYPVNCTNFCENVMKPGTLDYCPPVPNTWGFDPYYMKCFDASSPSPLNGMRTQLPSQQGTLDLDPLLPEISLIRNTNACIRMFLIHC